jgi:TolA-binding protein
MRAGVRALMVVLAVGVVALVGEPGSGAPEKMKGKLPPNYKKLGLSEEQTQAIYKLQSKYGAQIEELAQQIRKLRAEENAEIEKVLTDAQKESLKQLRLGELGKPKDAEPKAIDKGVGEKKPPEDKKPEPASKSKTDK